MPDGMRCANCGSTHAPVIGRGGAQTLQCPECEWPVGVPVLDAPLCSICRRRHGPERTHACE
jgi:hypothetical protein